MSTFVNITSILVNITVIIAAVFAVFKVPLYQILAPRYNTDMKVEQKYTIDGKLYVICTYVIENSGKVPIDLLEVSLQFYEGNDYYKVDKNTGEFRCIELPNHLPKRTFHQSEKKYKHLMKLSPGEKSEFPIRAVFNNYEKEYIFIYGSFNWEEPLFNRIYKKEPFPYHHTILISRKEN